MFSRFFYIQKHLKVTQLLIGSTIRSSQSEVVLLSNLQTIVDEDKQREWSLNKDHGFTLYQKIPILREREAFEKTKKMRVT